jgi:hypothetical protein
MADFLKELLKFLSEFTWRKLLLLVCIAAVGLGGFSLWERYTSSFRLGRLQKAADLMVRLQELQAHGTNSTPELERAKATLVTQAVQAIEEKPLTLDILPSTLKLSVDSLWRFLAGSALWFLTSLVFIPRLAGC